MTRHPQVIYREDIPAECIDDLSRAGQDASDMAKHWRVKLGFEVQSREDGVNFLAMCGIERERAASMEDDTMAEYVLWIVCNNFSSDDAHDIDVIE